MHPNPAGEQHEEQERIRWAEETLKREIEQIAAQLNDILGRENYVIDRDGNITPTRNASMSPKEEDAIKNLEIRLRQLYADLKKVSGRT